MKFDLFSIRSMLSLYRQELRGIYPPEESDQFVYLMLEAWAGYSKAKAHLRIDDPLQIEVQNQLLAALAELLRGKPVQYIIGNVSFAGVRLMVNPSVLIPRPETEQLVEFIYRDQAHQLYRDYTLLDICTGSGSIPIALVKKFPSLDATGTDISEAALDTARNNASLNACQVNFLKSDILDRKTWSQFPFYDIIISNPPYIPGAEKKSMNKNVLDYEPAEALFVPDEDPLIFYKEISAFASLHLNRPGYLYFEIHEKFGKQIKKIMSDAGFEKVAIHKDINGKDRFATGEARFAMKDQSYWHAEH